MNRSQMKFWVILAASLAAAPAARAGESLTVKQYDVTWTFDKPAQTGQFVNGDWWVIGPVTVVKVDPAPTTTASGKLINGSMINPTSGLYAAQAFDQRAGFWRANKGVTYPVALTVGQSLISSVCFENDEEAKGSRESQCMRIKYISVLTCLDKPAPATDFRPPFVGKDKPLYDSAKLRRDLLPDLPLPASLKEKDIPNLKNLAEARFSRPWIDFTETTTAYESDFGIRKVVDVGGAGLLLCLNKKEVGDKEPLLIGLVQTGIDLYAALINGRVWNDDMGKYVGRKFPILFAGLMLDNQEMLDIGRKYPPETDTFQEDVSAFIVTKADTERKLDCAISGPAQTAGPNTIGVIGGTKEIPGCTILKGWTELKDNRIKITQGPGAGQVRLITVMSWRGFNEATNPVVTLAVTPSWDVQPEIKTSFYQVLGYQEEDIGHAKFGCSHWGCSKTSRNRFYHLPGHDNPSNYEAFTLMHKSSWPAEVLAARILGLKSAWKQDAVFQLIDEYIAETLPGGPFAGKYGDSPLFLGVAQNQEPWPKYAISGDFIGAMWATYRSKYGDPPTACVK